MSYMQIRRLALIEYRGSYVRIGNDMGSKYICNRSPIFAVLIEEKWVWWVNLTSGRNSLEIKSSPFWLKIKKALIISWLTCSSEWRT